MEEKKYKLLEDDTIEVDGHTLYRIRALRDFGNISKGTIGGYIESEKNGRIGRRQLGSYQQSTKPKESGLKRMECGWIFIYTYSLTPLTAFM